MKVPTETLAKLASIQLDPLEIAILRMEHKVSHPKIARQLGVSVATLERMLRNAKDKVREQTGE